VRRVAITGIGLCTPVGVGTDETWSGLVEGRSGVGEIEGYDPRSLETRIGAEVRGLKPRDYVENRRSLRTMTQHDILAMVAAKIAIDDSGVDLGDDPEGRNALFTAGNKQVSDPDYFADASVEARDGDGVADMRRFGELAFGSVHPLFFIEGIQGASLFYISEAWGLRGANTYFSGTAEAGLLAIARGYRAVRRGEADLALCGGADSPVFWWHMAAWDTLGVLTRRNDLGAAACAPYDRDRDGTVMGEGGAFLLLEGLEAAQERGAHVYAEVAGTGAANDPRQVGRSDSPDEILVPDPSGRPMAAAIERALSAAGVAADAVDYVVTHGAGTKHGDAADAAGMRTAFGEDGPPASSIKPATGHLVGGAGALNAAVAALAIARGAMPPTLNLKNVDQTCEGVDWIAENAREGSVRQALALARGLEGQNVALALRAA
jgi:3-oxoacyl-[acyl-carrier-protein] synthase II